MTVTLKIRELSMLKMKHLINIFNGTFFIIISLGIILGVVIGEYNICNSVGGNYDWEYGICKGERSQ